MIVSLPLALSWVMLGAVFANRILAVGIGLWLKVPPGILFSLLLAIDIIQIPLFFRLYEHGSVLLEKVPVLNRLLRAQEMSAPTRRWASPLGGFGVMLVAALPTFGGGMWSATFLAHGLGLERPKGYAWMILGSTLSYLTLYWILSTLILTIQYFIH